MSNARYEDSRTGYYDSSLDDGSITGMERVKVEGLPGTWPQGLGRAEKASRAATFSAAARDVFGEDIPQDVIDDLVAQLNNERRVRDVEVAYDLAQQEAPLRDAMPAARLALHETRNAYVAFQAEHGAPRDFLPKGLVFVSGEDSMTAIEKYKQHIGPELAATVQTLSDHYRTAEAQVMSLVADLRAL